MKLIKKSRNRIYRYHAIDSDYVKKHIIPREWKSKKNNISKVLSRDRTRQSHAYTCGSAVEYMALEYNEKLGRVEKNNCAGESERPKQKFAGVFLSFRRKLGVRDRKRAVESRVRVRNACRIDFPVTERMFGRRYQWGPGYSG